MLSALPEYPCHDEIYIHIDRMKSRSDVENICETIFSFFLANF